MIRFSFFLITLFIWSAASDVFSAEKLPPQILEQFPAVEVAIQKFEKANEDVIAQYRSAVEMKQKRAQSEGNLNMVLQCDKILELMNFERFDADDFFNDRSDSDSDKQYASLKLRRNKAALTAVLSGTIKKLTQNGKLQEAVVLKNYGENIGLGTVSVSLKAPQLVQVLPSLTKVRINSNRITQSRWEDLNKNYRVSVIDGASSDRVMADAREIASYGADLANSFCAACLLHAAPLPEEFYDCQYGGRYSSGRTVPCWGCIDSRLETPVPEIERIKFMKSIPDMENVLRTHFKVEVDGMMYLPPVKEIGQIVEIRSIIGGNFSWKIVCDNVKIIGLFFSNEGKLYKIDQSKGMLGGRCFEFKIHKNCRACIIVAIIDVNKPAAIGFTNWSNPAI